MGSGENANTNPPGNTTMVTVPDLSGLSPDEATSQLQRLGLGAVINNQDGEESSAGTVVGQNPNPGEQVLEGESVSLTVGKANTENDLTSVVCLDPGHADTPSHVDEGTGLNTQDWANEPEMEIVFDIANRAKYILEAKGMEVVMTKQNVSDPVDLKQRAVIANNAHATLILHIHTDPGISNPTTFYPGASPNDWKGNYETGRKVYVDPQVQKESERLAKIFEPAVAAYLQVVAGVRSGGTMMENRGSTGTGNYGPVLNQSLGARETIACFRLPY